MREDRRTDEWGRVILNPDMAFELAYQGLDIWKLPIDAGGEIDRFNELCRVYDTGIAIEPVTPLAQSPEDFHAEKASRWLYDEAFQTIDVRAFILSLCETDEERSRVNLEMDLFEERNLTPVLQLMIHLVDNFRTNKVVWGVGRGSSVASYCLYLIGIHRVNSLRYGLDIREFLK